ncbi:hypothetical protein HaLaN_25505, partial [Haematococcus lacustris]
MPTLSPSLLQISWHMKEQLNVAQARLAHQASAAAAVAADASPDAHASATLLEQEQQLNATLVEETELLHQHVTRADAATMAVMADAEDKGVRLRACMADSKQLHKECCNLMKR